MTSSERSSYPYNPSGGASAADASKDDLASKGAAAFRDVKANIESVIADAGEKSQQALNYAGQKSQEAMDKRARGRRHAGRRSRKISHQAPLRHPRAGRGAGVHVRSNLAPLV